MTLTTTLSFQNVEEELEYYKNRSKDLELELEETKFALDEFQLSSKELEEELEKEIDSTERRCNEIKIRNEGMRQEVEDWKVCLQRRQHCIFPSALHIFGAVHGSQLLSKGGGGWCIALLVGINRGIEMISSCPCEQSPRLSLPAHELQSVLPLLVGKTL